MWEIINKEPLKYKYMEIYGIYVYMYTHMYMTIYSELQIVVVKCYNQICAKELLPKDHMVIKPKLATRKATNLYAVLLLPPLKKF